MRTLIIDDQALFRDLLAAVCRKEFHFGAVQAVRTAGEAIVLLQESPFDLVIVDIELPDRDGVDLAEELVTTYPQSRFLGMSSFCDEVMVSRILNSRLSGFLDKGSHTVDDLRTAIEVVMSGRCYYSETVRQIQDRLRDDPLSFPKLLTARECAMIRLIGAGLSNQEIGVQAGITEGTALWHRKQIMRKLNIHSATDLMLYASQKGFSRWPTTVRDREPSLPPS